MSLKLYPTEYDKNSVTLLKAGGILSAFVVIFIIIFLISSGPGLDIKKIRSQQQALNVGCHKTTTS